MHLRKELNCWLYAIILFFSSNIYFFNYNWNGIIRVYITGKQLRIKIRVLGLICGMIPIANLIMLFIILSKTVSKGGLDSRSAICFEGMDQYVASLTTISCLTKDYCEDFNKKAIDSPLFLMEI